MWKLILDQTTHPTTWLDVVDLWQHRAAGPLALTAGVDHQGLLAVTDRADGHIAVLLAVSGCSDEAWQPVVWVDLHRRLVTRFDSPAEFEKQMGGPGRQEHNQLQKAVSAGRI